MITIPQKNAEVWSEFWKSNKVLVFKYIVRQVSRAIKDNKTEIGLFKFEGSNVEKNIGQDEYIEVLSTGLDLFIENEEFEYAEKTKQLIIEYQLSSLTDQIIKQED